MESAPNINERKSFISTMEGPDGSSKSLSISIEADGKPKFVVFEDIDKTLLHLEPTYNEIRKAMWPEAVAKDGLEGFTKVHLDGFQLGTMWRELYRIYAIYDLGKEEWKDENIYAKEFLAPGKDGENIDEPGDKYYKFANELLEKFDTIAAQTVETQAKENPELFEKAKIQAMYRLNTQYVRLGIPVLGMSANPRKFIEAICKYTGLSEQFLDCATDTDVPGTKEHKMKWLVERLEKQGLSVPYGRFLVIGDSPMGDVGSASRFQALVADEHPEVSASGIVIIKGDEELEIAAKKLESVKDINIHTFDYTKSAEDMMQPHHKVEKK
ncbi:MAG TPA: HAD family hydrolase [Candidatus Paceibacterota bacterium]|jgi:phosphoglycolate phosphatase-like HAD superfamily hydrolase|nr:HAD family hydrolase [Candidatus Paceibacterota bacterium]